MPTEAETKGAESGAPAPNASQQGGAPSGSDAGSDAEKPNSKGWEAAEKWKAESLKERSAREAAQKELEAFRAKEKQAEEKRLADEGKWQELATKHQTESKSLKQALRSERIERAVITHAVKAGFNDPEDVVRFVNVPDDLDDSKKDELAALISGEVEKLSKAKPYLLKQETAAPPAKPNAAQTKAAPPGGPAPYDPKKDGMKAMWSMKPDQLAQIASGKT